MLAHFIVILVGLGIGEYANCKYPRVEEGYSSEGFVCNWEEDDFYKMNDEYYLSPVDSTDNCFEKKAREKYWENK
jgi:hypothetical protein